MVVLGRGVTITGIRGEDEGIIGNGKDVILYYNLHICEFIYTYVYHVHPIIKYIYEYNYINITIYNICTIFIELERNFLSSSVTILHHIVY